MKSPFRDRLRMIPGRVYLLAIVVLLSVSICFIAIIKGWVNQESLQRAIKNTGSLGMLIYVLGVIICNLLWFPRMWGLFAGGMLFGPWVGGSLSMVGDLCAALICFQIARSTGRDFARNLIEKRPRAKRLVDILAVRQGTLTMAFLRVCPVFHYTLASYAAGVVGVSLGAFLLGTAVGIIPGAVLYPIAGNAIYKPTSPIFLSAVGAILLALFLTLFIARRVIKQKKK